MERSMKVAFEAGGRRLAVYILGRNLNLTL